MDQPVKFQHKELAAGRWTKFSIAEQMTHIGGEISRALNWQAKSKKDFSEMAAVRSLELIDLSLTAAKTFSQKKEFARLREAVVDYFFGSNTFSSSDAAWRKYFDPFNYATRKTSNPV